MKMKFLWGAALGALLLCNMSALAVESDSGSSTNAPSGHRADTSSRRGKVMERFKDLGEKLGLTDEQKSKFRDLVMEEMRKVRGSRSKDGVTDKREALRKFQESLRERLKESKLLTEEQLQKLKESGGLLRSRRGGGV